MVPSPNKNPAFVPSPRWLSESPARPGTLTHVEQRTPSSQKSRDRSQELRSPIPPPPANLYEGGAAAFNVDPGIPFLATAGPTEAGSSEGGSIKEESPQDKRFVGGFVTGIKRAVRNSLKRRTEPRLPLYAQPPQFRDSGYAGSTSQLNPPPPIAPPQHFRSSSSPSYDSPARPVTETILAHPPPNPKLHDQSTVTENHRILSPGPMDSPHSAKLEFDPGYRAKNPPPAPSETSLRSYLRRASQLVSDISTLPWVSPDRVTVDYYPERTKRRDEPQRHPAIIWTHQNLSVHEYLHSHPGGLDLDSTGSEMSIPIEDFMSPRGRTSYEDMDLDDEFDQEPTFYSPRRPGYITRTPQGPPPAHHITHAPSDRDQYTPRPFPLDETWAGATSQVQHPPIGLWQTVSTTSPRHPPPPSRPTSHRPPHTNPNPPPRSAPPSEGGGGGSSGGGGGTWQQYPREMGGYVPYEFAEHYYGDKYGPGVHAARPPLPGAPSPAFTSTASSRQQQQQPKQPIPVSSPRA